jgi:hypothetical protein
VRCGSDVALALALGATAVGIGRPVVWGLAAGGERGVRHVLELLRENSTTRSPCVASARPLGRKPRCRGCGRGPACALTILPGLDQYAA